MLPKGYSESRMRWLITTSAWVFLVTAARVLTGLQAAETTPQSFGAKGDVRVITDAAIAAGSVRLASPSANFTSSDTGKWISIYGAGRRGYGLTAQIASVSGATSAELSLPASTTVQGATANIGSDDSIAFQSALNVAKKTGGVNMRIPRGRYFTTGLLFYSNTAIQAGGAEIIQLFKTLPENTRNQSLMRPASSEMAKTRNFSVDSGVWDANYRGTDWSSYAASDAANIAFVLWGVDQVGIRHATIKNGATDAIYIGAVRVGNAGTEASGVIIENNTIDTWRRNGIAAAGGVGIEIKNNVFRNITERGPTLAIDFEPRAGCTIHDVMVSGNQASNTGGGYTFESAGKGLTYKGRFSDNRWMSLSNTNYGAYVIGVHDYTSTNEVFSYAPGKTPCGSCVGISLMETESATITNATVENARRGLWIHGHCRNVTVQGCQIRNSFLEAMFIENGATGQASGITIENASTSGPNYPAISHGGGKDFTLDSVVVRNGKYNYALSVAADDADCTNCTLPTGARGVVNDHGHRVGTHLSTVKPK